jgi:2-polyprenyl-6-methoxyphenol hydroxylase-like FAD-dependent oxidoreductase
MDDCSFSASCDSDDPASVGENMHTLASAICRDSEDLATPGAGPLPQRAIVIGAGIAGLLAARVLADHYSWVGIVERDELPAAPVARKGVPQARHGHLMLVQGRRMLEHLFPDLDRELLGLGAVPVDWYSDVHWFGPGGWMAHSGSDRCFSTWSTSRDLLEFVLRRRVFSQDRIEVFARHEAIGLDVGERTGRVQGVRIQPRGHHGTPVASLRTLPADLVVDACGRTSRTPMWLDVLGYGTPQETEVNAFLGYASRLYRRPRGLAVPAWKVLVVSASPPACARGGIIMPIEGDRWIVTLMGAGRDYPPADDAGFLDFARSLRFSGIHDAIVDAEPVSPAYCYRHTENRFRHYEHMERWPGGFVVIGDAVCGFNPMYAQGMTVAAIAARLLERSVRARSDAQAVNPSFQRELATACAGPWAMATGADFLYPTTEGGARQWHTRLAQRYLDQVLALSAECPDVYHRMLHVMHMVDGPTTLFAPLVAMRVASRAGRRLLYAARQHLGEHMRS